jgi:hypothetical protein
MDCNDSAALAEVVVRSTRLGVTVAQLELVLDDCSGFDTPRAALDVSREWRWQQMLLDISARFELFAAHRGRGNGRHGNPSATGCERLMLSSRSDTMTRHDARRDSNAWRTQIGWMLVVWSTILSHAASADTKSLNSTDADRASQQVPDQVDVVVYGGTSGGITAAIQTRLLGHTVLLIEPSQHLGGLTSGGLGATDIGNKAAIGGLARQFYRRIGDHYRQPSAWNREPREQYFRSRKDGQEPENWTFEPHVAEAVYRQWLAEHQVPVLLGQRLQRSRRSIPGLKGPDQPSGVRQTAGRITAVVMESGQVISGRMFLDATYEGDLMAEAGVPYHVGREANSVYGETLNGIQVARSLKHQFTVAVDPFRIKGDPGSGLLPLVQAEPPGRDGDGDHRVQAYCFRMCTTDVPENRRAWSAPDDYRVEDFELLLRNFDAGDHRRPWHPLFMPNRKTDTNNNFAISTDYLGANYEYPDGDYATRDAIFAAHLKYQQGLMYTLATHPRVPKAVRDEFQRLGLAKDEFVDHDNWPHQLYVREARRMISDGVMTQQHCEQKIISEDPVGLGAYNMDSHNVQRYVTAEGVVRNEGDIQVGVSPYRISYRSIRPAPGTVPNLLVPVCLAASHIAYGSIRMEPVFMVLGQSAATAAVLSLKAGTTVQDLSYSALREQLLADGQVLDWTEPMRSAPVAKDIASLKGVVLDNTSARLVGDWASSSSIPGFYGADYLHDSHESPGGKQATFELQLPQAGRYQVRLSHTANANRATNVPVTLTTGAQKHTAKWNQRQPTDKDGLVTLFTLDLPEMTPILVSISNANVDGYVVVDALQLVLVE